MTHNARMANERSIMFQQMAQEVREVNEANGWFEDDRRFGEDIALLHSEVSEALEAFRDNGVQETYRWDTGPLPKPEGVGSEMADILIRLLDTCDRYGIDLYHKYQEKLKYNATRGHKHGGKAL